VATVGHWITPKVDDRLIEALGWTVAPFSKREKPQVFPRPATSFIKNGPDISMLEAGRQTPLSLTAQMSEKCRRDGYACFDWNFATI
jgi:hypothetical protein